MKKYTEEELLEKLQKMADGEIYTESDEIRKGIKKGILLAREVVKNNVGLADISGSVDDFYRDLMKLINTYTSKGLKKNLLIHKMEYATINIELS